MCSCCCSRPWGTGGPEKDAQVLPTTVVVIYTKDSGLLWSTIP
jgi:hypothetical protein